MKLPNLDLQWQERAYDVVEPLSATEVLWNNRRRLVQACSTQYLGLLWSAEFQRARREVCERSVLSDFGSIGSHYLGGTHPSKVAFERTVAAVCQCEDAVSFSSGWLANYAVGEILSRCYDVVLSDVRNHNSLHRGLERGPAIINRIDLGEDNIDTAIQSHRDKRIAVVATSIHGLTGERLTIRNGSAGLREVLLVLDEVHSFGMLGQDGCCAPSGVQPDVRVVGFGKALGVAGGTVCGPSAFTRAVRQLASTFVFSTVAPPILWKLCQASLDVCRKMSAEREKVSLLANAFRAKLGASGLRHSGMDHVTGLYLASDVSAPDVEEALRTAGFYLKVSQYPSRPRNSPCIRIAFNPYHQVEMVEHLAASLTAVALKEKAR